MDQYPLVSIVTPSFNQAAYLEQTIKSVLDQGYPDLEYMIVDGGSTDGSVEIIKKYADRLAWWVSEKDSGQAEAINKGFSRCKGEFIAWLNSDDLYLNGSIQLAVETLLAHPEAAMVYGDVLSINQSGKPINLMRYGNWGLDGLMQFKIIGQPGVTMRRTALEKAGYLDKSYHYMLDTHLWLRVAQYGDAVYVKQTWAAARYHESAKNISQPEGFGREAYRVLDWMKEQPTLKEKYQVHENKILAGVHLFNARYLLDGNKLKEALKYYWKSFKCHAPTALKEWHRIVYIFGTFIGFKFVKGLYLKMRAFFKRKELQNHQGKN
jgi:glycosyltransferase involved in cell wall biosynthesis